MAKEYLDNIVSLSVFSCLLFAIASLAMAESEYSPAVPGIPSFEYSSSSASSTVGDESAAEIPSEEYDGTLSFDLRGIELTELFKVLSQKLEKNIIPSSIF